MTTKTMSFTCHGMYAEDYGFELERKLGVTEAFDILKASPWIATKPDSIGDRRTAELLFNKGWAVVEIDRPMNIIKVVYNNNGRYSLHRGSLNQFMTITRSIGLWGELKKIHDYVQEVSTL